MKRKEFRLALTLLACVLLSVLLAMPAMALNNKEEEEVRIEVLADPAELSESGTVLLTFEISNHSDFELHEITIGLDNAIFQVDGMDCEDVGQALGEQGIAVRSGLHCAPLAHRSAGTLDVGTIRVSFSAFNSSGDVDALAGAVARLPRRQ